MGTTRTRGHGDHGTMSVLSCFAAGRSPPNAARKRLRKFQPCWRVVWFELGSVRGAMNVRLKIAPDARRGSGVAWGLQVQEQTGGDADQSRWIWDHAGCCHRIHETDRCFFTVWGVPELFFCFLKLVQYFPIREYHQCHFISLHPISSNFCIVIGEDYSR
jgi:hypothetical protein